MDHTLQLCMVRLAIKRPVEEGGVVRWAFGDRVGNATVRPCDPPLAGPPRRFVGANVSCDPRHGQHMSIYDYNTQT